MKKKIILSALTLLVIALVSFSLMGCDWLVSYVAAPTGYVKDVKNEGSPGVEGVIVKLTPIVNGALVPANAKTATATTENGYYTFLSLDYGKYELTATKTGWVFLPQIVDLYGVSQQLPPLLGYQYNATASFSIILVWDDANRDLDAYMSYPINSTGAGTGPTFYPYADLPNSGRDNVNWQDKESVPAGISLDIDASALNMTGTNPVPPVETITFSDDTASDIQTISNFNGYDLGSSTQWWGVYAYYILGWGSSVISEQGSPLSSGARIYIMANDFESTDTCIGIYEIPTRTNIDVYEALRIHAFNDSWKIFVSGRILPNENAIRSFDTSKGYIEIPRP